MTNQPTVKLSPVYNCRRDQTMAHPGHDAARLARASEMLISPGTGDQLARAGFAVCTGLGVDAHRYGGEVDSPAGGVCYLSADVYEPTKKLQRLADKHCESFSEFRDAIKRAIKRANKRR